MRNPEYDKFKPLSQLRKEQGKICEIEGCNNPLTPFKGPGSDVLCRDCQVSQREYGGLGRIDRKHTFGRKWVCEDCGYNPLEDPRLADVSNIDEKHSIARTLVHGDHHGTTKAAGGGDNLENMKSLCYVCHSKKTILNKDHLQNRKGTKNSSNQLVG